MQNIKIKGQSPLTFLPVLFVRNIIHMQIF